MCNLSLFITAFFYLINLQTIDAGELPLVSKRNESISADALNTNPKIPVLKKSDGSQYDNFKFDNEKCRYRISKGYIIMEGQTRRLTMREINQLDKYYQQRATFNQIYKSIIK